MDLILSLGTDNEQCRVIRSLFARLDIPPTACATITTSKVLFLMHWNCHFYIFIDDDECSIVIYDKLSDGSWSSFANCFYYDYTQEQQHDFFQYIANVDLAVYL
jgi:hypothetical protein